MTQAKHTPLPKLVAKRIEDTVEIRAADDSEELIIILDDPIGVGYEYIADDRGAFIVRACNSHEKAVNMLYSAWQFIEDLKKEADSHAAELLTHMQKQQDKYNALIFEMTGECIGGKAAIAKAEGGAA